MSNKTNSDPMNSTKFLIMRPNSKSCQFNKKHLKDLSNQHVSLKKEEILKNNATKIPLKTWNNQNGQDTDNTLSQNSIHCKESEIDTTASLSDQIHTLNIKLFSCLNKNHTLRREINFATAVAKREIDDHSNHFEDIEKKIDAGDWMGRREMIISLKNKLNNLYGLIEERDRLSDFRTWKSEKFSFDSIPKDDRSYWMLQLERSKILRTREREKTKLLQERNKQKEKLLHAIKSNSRLFSELQNLRDKKSQLPAKSDSILSKQMHKISCRIRHCLFSKAQLLKSLTEEGALMRLHSKEIIDLKNEIDSQKETYRELEEQLLCLESENENNHFKRQEEEKTEKYIDQYNSVLEELKNGFQQQKKGYVTLTYKTNVQDGIDFFNPRDSIDSDFDRKGDVQNEDPDKKDCNSKRFPQSNESETRKNKIDDSCEVSAQNSSKTNKSNINLETRDEEYQNITMEEVSRLKSSCKEAEEYIANNLTNIYHHFDQIRDNARQLLENKALLSKLSADNQLTKLKTKFFSRIPLDASTKNNETMRNWTFSNITEVGELFLNVLEKEEEFLKNSLNLGILNTEEVNDFYSTGLRKTEDMFTTNLDQMRNELYNSSSFKNETNDVL